METNNQRSEEFKEEIAAMTLHPPEDRTERRWLIAGMLLVVLGLIAIVVGWWGASGSKYATDQLPYLISGGALGLGLIVAGGALFVRYSMTRYLRFWLVRLIYEQRTQTDREVEVLERVETLLRQATRTRSQSE